MHLAKAANAQSRTFSAQVTALMRPGMKKPRRGRRGSVAVMLAQRGTPAGHGLMRARGRGFRQYPPPLIQTRGQCICASAPLSLRYGPAPDDMDVPRDLSIEVVLEGKARQEVGLAGGLPFGTLFSRCFKH